MAHARTQIRAAVENALANLPTTATRVYQGRTRALGETYDPTLLIYATDEESEVDAIGASPILMRQLSLVIDGRAQDVAADALEDLLDEIQLEVEPAMLANPLLGGLAIEVTLSSTRISITSPGANHQGDIRMQYRILYRTHENAPATAV